VTRDLVPVADWLRKRAMAREFDDSTDAMDYARDCSLQDKTLGLYIMLTRNADKFWHLVMADLGGKSRELSDFNEWIEAFFKIHLDKVWFQEDQTAEGLYRYSWFLCCDDNWRPVKFSQWNETRGYVSMIPREMMPQ